MGQRVVFDIAMAKSYYKLPEKEIKLAVAELVAKGVLVENEGAYLLKEDAKLLESYKPIPLNFVYAVYRNDLLEMQKALQDKYKGKWEPIGPETGKNKMLWMIGEVGEVIDIVKKNGGTNATTNSELRKDLVEELADVLMYYNDVLLCYRISADELKTAYVRRRYQSGNVTWLIQILKYYGRWRITLNVVHRKKTSESVQNMKEVIKEPLQRENFCLLMKILRRAEK